MVSHKMKMSRSTERTKKPKKKDKVVKGVSKGKKLKKSKEVNSKGEHLGNSELTLKDPKRKILASLLKDNRNAHVPSTAQAKKEKGKRFKGIKVFGDSKSVMKNPKKITAYTLNDNEKAQVPSTSSMEVEERTILHDIDDRNDRTIFVGNLPLTVTVKHLKRLFSKFGSIESARIRCSALKKSHLPRNVVLQQRDFHPKATSLNGYVKFKNSESISKALMENGSLYVDHILRIDRVQPEEEPEKAIFVGNMPFAVADDELREVFKDCGEIESVRVIRDKDTGVGKGFGYVNFKTTDAVELALALEGTHLKRRPIRVRRTVKKFGSKSAKDKTEKVEKSEPQGKQAIKSKKNKKESLAFQGRTVADKVIKKKKKPKKIKKELMRKQIIELINKK